ncbi:hypothetical protein NF700_06395 [Sphingomonadaceae bacterium OTU29MARTA1]|uniref:hypothetical protein n=1 Tax=Sphingomonas sp. Leaf37 TaxID=2876552 RepID=UPI001E423E67|nr:hypothetical protein [Sphingomonas sp. Leaf37]USU06454.1 hypothetical protein NF699_07295 [Sphingomonadaceae bacterium OTU29LAMAA1]USU09889.1 hypothetical protein NF700_06395 [Sphingomonadaceae bacterium OTU29MARTA1]USU13352.1 hypothetical protein NF701_05855 [Sphingomonadaceae bacterium OTU29THOMA1]
MKSPLLLSATAALLALAACNSKPAEPDVLDSNPDPMATELANRAPVELPPSIKAEKTFRCKDNSLLYVTLFNGDKLAFVKTTPTGTINRLTAETAGDPLTAEGGWSLTGTPSSITVTQPGKPSQTCKS